MPDATEPLPARQGALNLTLSNVDVGWVCGVDEAGRGPLAGPVVAAAVILDPTRPIEGLRDSKALSSRQRAGLAQQIRESARGWAIAEASVDEIDHLNILQATLLAMRRAVLLLPERPVRALIDGNRPPVLPCEVITLVAGDTLEPSISAASILAKTERDAVMLRLHERFPQYGFDVHKGYPTAAHRAALVRHGVSPVHRRSFAPVRRLLSHITPSKATHAD
ncbi:MAG: ribonuclease HII [Burkholderiales bacterium]|jgi:ribonuclease HII